jgi:hypothetical protein
MTAKKDLKRRIRERQAKTGESYTAARAQVLAHGETADDPKPGAFPVVELIDASETAASLGLKCDVLVSPLLAQRVPPARILEKLRNALMATEHDPLLELLRGLAFRGERPIRPRNRLPNWWESVRRFIARAEAGIGGVTDAGDMLAFTVDDVMVIAQAGYVPDMPAIPRVHDRRRLFLTSADAHHIDGSAIVLPR